MTNRSVRDILTSMSDVLDGTNGQLGLIELRLSNLLAEAFRACDLATIAAAPVDPPLTADEAAVLGIALRHAEKHQSAVFYDLEAQWPHFVSAKAKVESLRSPWTHRPSAGWTPETLPEAGKKVMVWAFGKMHWTAINDTWRASEIADMDAWRYVDPPTDAPADTGDAGGKDGAE